MVSCKEKEDEPLPPPGNVAGGKFLEIDTFTFYGENLYHEIIGSQKFSRELIGNRFDNVYGGFSSSAYLEFRWTNFTEETLENRSIDSIILFPVIDLY